MPLKEYRISGVWERTEAFLEKEKHTGKRLSFHYVADTAANPPDPDTELTGCGDAHRSLGQQAHHRD